MRPRQGPGPGVGDSLTPQPPTPNPASEASYMGWRLRPKGFDWGEGLQDRDPRGRPKRLDTADSPTGSGNQQLQLGSGASPSTYVELHCHTCYSFREGASTPRQLLARAAGLGYRELAVTDRDGLYGAMEFAGAARSIGIRPIVGADVTLQGGYRMVLLAETREGYANLCQLISEARLAEARRENGEATPSPPPSPRGRGCNPPQPRQHPIGVRPEIPNPAVSLRMLAQHTRGLIALSGDEHGEVPWLVASGQWDQALAVARRYAAWFGLENFYIELTQTLTLGDTQRNRALVELARQLGLGVVATNDVWYHVRERHRLHDVLVAVHHRTTLDGSHPLRHANSERYLKSAEEMAQLFEDVPEAIENTVAIAERCTFDLATDLGYEFPHAPVPPGETPDTHLATICWEAFERKYPRRGSPEGPSPSGGGNGGCPPFPILTPPPLQGEGAGGRGRRTEAALRLDEELELVQMHGLAGFFLAYYDLLTLAGEIASELRGRDPTLPPDERPVGRGRGSSISSIVCYLIGLSHIDPIANELFLGRFLNEELTSVPDIDLDFPRDIREELLKRVWTKFDEGRAALVCAYSTYHGRAAVRDVGKALGLPALEIDHLAKLLDAWSGDALGKEMDRLPEFKSRLATSPWRDLLELGQQLIGLPRHITQHVGGVVLSARPMQEIVPLEPARMEGRVMCQWDKDAVEDARMVKIDFLALGMLSLVDECLDTIEHRHGKRPDLGRIPHDDPEIYDSICSGDTIGLFQIESRAQIASLQVTQPRNLDDLAVQVAIIRPGPIMGGAFHPFMEYRRRLLDGEPVDVKYIHPKLESVLKDTLGAVLYQEQVVQVAMEITGCTAGQADQLRRNLNRRNGAELVGDDWSDFLQKGLERGFPEESIRAAFRAILGFAAYGFPKSHAVAFALLAYESAWLRFHYPAEYYAALLDCEPMGFYHPEVLAGDARRHGIEFARPDVNLSGTGCVVETDHRIRLGLADVKGIGRDIMHRSPVADAIVAEREIHGPYASVVDFTRRTGLRPEAVENFILAGAFDGVRGGARREMLWELGLLRGTRGVQRGRALRADRPLPVGGVQRGSAPLAGGVGGVPPAPSLLPLPSKGGGVFQKALPLPIDQDMVKLTPMSEWEEVAAEYEILGLSPDQHAMALIRGHLDPDIKTSDEAVKLPEGTEVRVAGLAVCRQRPSTAKDIVFVSLEDEYGLANLVVYPQLFDRQRALIVTTPFLIARGRVQRQRDVVHIVAHEFERLDVRTDRLIRVSHDFR
jgi:error-prone DNA polymerase